MNPGKLGALLVLPLLVYAGKAESALALQEFTLHTMLEATAAVFTTLGDYTLSNPDGISNGTADIGTAGISWSGSYSDSAWSYTGSGVFGGLALSMSYSGLLTGSDGSDIGVTISGTGTLGSKPLLMNGFTNWKYDLASDDYLEMDFAQETKIGTNTRWGWTTGRERLVCVGPGKVPGSIAGNELVLTGIASSGKRSGFDFGHKYCLVPGGDGRVGVMTISSYTKSTLNAFSHVAPAFAALPLDNELFDPSVQGTLIADNGALYADDMDNRYRSEGRFAGNSFSGLTFSVAEPSAAWTIALGLLGLWGTRTPRAKRTL